LLVTGEIDNDIDYDGKGRSHKL